MFCSISFPFIYSNGNIFPRTIDKIVLLCSEHARYIIKFVVMYIFYKLNFILDYVKTHFCTLVEFQFESTLVKYSRGIETFVRKWSQQVKTLYIIKKHTEDIKIHKEAVFKK